MVKESLVLSLVILVAFQMCLSLRGSSVKGEFVGLPLPYWQKYVSMSVTPHELDLGSILEATFAAVALARTWEPFIYNNGGVFNRENSRVFCRLNDKHIIEPTKKLKGERGGKG